MKPGFTPAPAIQTVKARPWWSRPYLGESTSPCTYGVRPNSPAQITNVSSSKPRIRKSWISAPEAMSVSSHCIRNCCDKLPCVSQPTWNNWMKRTPRSASRRARMQFAAYVPGVRECLPYRSKT